MASDTPAERAIAAIALLLADVEDDATTHRAIAEDIYHAAGPHIRAEEREACARLAEQNNATYSPPCTKPNCAAAPHRVGQAPFADLIRARTAP